MPTYEYRCAVCGKEFEAVQKITDPPLKKCKFCSGKVTRLISHSAFVLKGSGWYVTDYPRAGAKKEEKTEKEEGTPPLKEKGEEPPGKKEKDLQE